MSEKKGHPPSAPPAAYYPGMQQVPPMGAPPPYTAAPAPGHQAYAPQAYYPGSAVPQPQAAYGQPGPMYGQPGYPMAPAMPAYAAPTGQTVVVPGLFDAGARFDGGSQAHIPPPPPGCAPNAAQLAAMQGHQVVGTQRRSNFWTDGTGSGGMSFF